MLNLLANRLLIISMLLIPLKAVAIPDYNSLFTGVNACFTVYDVNSRTYKTTYNGELCEEQLSPCSTFKVALSLMGFDSKILLDENTPKWDFKESYSVSIESHRNDHTPKSWMQNSVVWYSRVLTEKLGLEKVKGYLNKFSYGNQDMSGNAGKNDGLSSAWLTSGASLKISANEQIEFLNKFISTQLPISKDAMQKTKEIMLVGELVDGWKVYGKTGTGYQRDNLGKLNEDLQIGWFVGWIEKGEQTYIFALNVRDKQKVKQYAGPRSKDIAMKLFSDLDFIKEESYYE